MLFTIVDRLHDRDATTMHLKRSHAWGHSHAGQLDDQSRRGILAVH
jgi:hypothetical protein